MKRIALETDQSPDITIEDSIENGFEAWSFTGQHGRAITVRSVQMDKRAALAGEHPGAINQRMNAIYLQEVSTTVSGLLGLWMPLGGVNSQSTRNDSRIGGSRTTTSRRDDDIYVKVERLD